MQADLGGQISDTEMVAGYTYAARYLYSDAVVLNDNFLRISACEDAYQTPMSSSVMTTPPARPIRYKDRLGNPTHRVRLTSPHKELVILSVGSVRMQPVPTMLDDVPLDSLIYEAWADEFLSPSPIVAPERLADAAQRIAGDASSLLGVVEGVIRWIHTNITYISGSTTVATTAEQVLDSRQGVCQDMTHLAMGMLRALGVPARYVSGLLGTQVGETHAWLEFLHPQVGWLPSDPTRGQTIAAGMDFVKFAIGRDYTQAAPIEGSFVSTGSGWLDIAVAQIIPTADSLSFDDALNLLDGNADRC